MSTGEDISSLRKILDMSRAIGICLLLLHFYYYCYTAFEQWQLTSDILSRILQHITATGLFHHALTSKILAMLFLALSLLGMRGRKNEEITFHSCVKIILAGLFLYFGSSILLILPDSTLFPAIAYMIVTAAGFITILTGGARLSRVLNFPFITDDPFGRQLGGFPQEERQIVTNFSINLPAQYTYKDKTRNSWINIINPRRGTLILGSPGSGKSWFIIEPIIRQLIEKGFALFIYDFKYDTLTRIAYHLFTTYQDRYPKGTTFFSINFTHPSLSHRCNVLHPSTIDWVSDAQDISRTILLSMNKTWIHDQGNFFVESPINFVAALIWFLRKYQGGIYCTLPHVIELAQVPYDKLFTVLNTEPEIHILIGSFIETYRSNNMKLLDSQIVSARIPLGRLASPDLYYILTGDDCNLDINDPIAPKILCLGGDPSRQEALAPVISLYIDRLNKRVNQKDKYKCALICDEFATVRAYSMTTTIATARSNNIVPILAIQDLSQLRTQYSRDEADLILNISGNLLCGQVGGETARWISDRFPKLWQDKTSISINSADTSISKSHQWEPAMIPATIATLSSGEFVGIVADDPGREISLKAFHAKLVKDPKDSFATAPGAKPTAAPAAGQGTRQGNALPPLPVIREVDANDIQENFRKVRQDIATLVDAEMAKILNDPGMTGFIVTKE